MLSLSKSALPVGKKVVESSHTGFRQTSEKISEIFEGLDFQLFASLKEVHEYCGSAPAVDGADKEPDGAAETIGLMERSRVLLEM